VKTILYVCLNKIAVLFKGNTYQLDPKIPLGSLLEYSFSRLVALARCFFRGVVISINPRKLIFLGANVELKNRNLIYFGTGVTLGKNVTIDGLSIEGVTIGNGVNIGPYTIIEATGIISNLGKGVYIGENSGLGAFSFIGGAGGVVIGKNVIMGQRISFHSENHICDRTDLPIRMQGVTRQGIEIEDDCWVGANVTFLDGSHVCSGCVIAAGSVVRGYIPPYSVIAGVPAKVIKSRKTDNPVE
jgi:acetyltransferase-like isoleucine patch superfamily enzyme